MSTQPTLTGLTAEQLVQSIHRFYDADTLADEAAAMLRSQAAEIVSLETTIERLEQLISKYEAQGAGDMP